MFAGFSFRVVALQKCAQASVSARTIRSQMAPFSFGMRGVSFSEQSVANAASFGFREFRLSRHECEQESS